MPRIALKIDVDTFRGTRDGVPRLAALLEKLDVRATFLFSLGPDHTGRAIKRVFRSGFMRKVQRTSVLEHYGLKTLLYGTLLPGPHIGKRCADIMRDIERRGFEVGVHTYDHIKWQDGVAKANGLWARRQLELAQREFQKVFGRRAEVHGAAGWQLNPHVPQLERELAFRYASDTRGNTPFVPVINGKEVLVPQIPTTLPTLDELIGLSNPTESLLALTAGQLDRDHVFTLHAELEGGAYIGALESVLQRWRSQGFELTDLRTVAASLDIAKLPRCAIAMATVPGRAGTLACQQTGNS